MDNKDYKQVASEIEKNMATMGLDKYDEEEGNHLISSRHPPTLPYL